MATVSLAHLKKEGPTDGREPWEIEASSSSDAPAVKRRIAWSGGKMTTNKEVALAKFLLKKNGDLNDTQREALARAVKGTVYEEHASAVVSADANAADASELLAVASAKAKARAPTDDGDLRNELSSRKRKGKDHPYGGRGGKGGRGGRGAPNRSWKSTQSGGGRGGGGGGGGGGGVKKQRTNTTSSNSGNQRSGSLTDRIGGALGTGR